MFAICPVQSGVTDADGRFVTPRRFLKQGRFEAAALRYGVTIAETMRRAADTADLVTFADLVYAVPAESMKVEASDAAADSPDEAAQLVDVAGVVEDRQGQPVSGATIIAWSQGQRMRRTADAEGRFKFPQVSPAGVWLFADAQGFRFRGGYFVPGGEPTKLTLVRRDEAVEPLRPRDDRLSDEQRDSLRKKFAAYAAAVMDGDDHSAMGDVQWMMPRVDPELALQDLADPRFDIFQTNFNDPEEAGRWRQNVIRLFAAEHWAADDPEKAISSIAAMSPGDRFRGYLAVVAGARNATPHQRVGWLEQALTDARLAEGNSAKIIALAEIAKQFDVLGQRAKALDLFREAVSLTDQPLGTGPRDGFALGHLAWSLAPLDPKAALALLDKVPENTRVRTIGNLAHQLAVVDPDEAERLLAQLEPDNRDRIAERVCYRLAPVDLPRARRIAAAINEPSLRAHALGVMAQAIAEQRPDVARALLDEAYADLDQQVADNHSGGRTVYQPFPTAVALLRAAEIVAPDRLDEFVWRTLSYRQNQTHGSESRVLGRFGPAGRLRLSDPVLAAFVARYDLEAARQILLPADDETLDFGPADAPYSFFTGLAAIDPTAAIDAVARLPVRTEEDRQRKLEAWQRIVNLLARSGDERWNWLQERQYYLWIPDKVDL
jgi:hypothetical protein